MKRNIVFCILPCVIGCSGDVFSGIDDGGDPLSDSGGDVLGNQDAQVPQDGQVADGGITLEADANDFDVLPDVIPPQFRRIFVTSETMPPDFGGLTQADVLCTTAASAGGLGGTWKAWLSTSTTDAAARLEHANVPYVLLDGTEIAKNWSGLTSGTIEHAVDLDEHKNTAPSSGGVFTGTKVDGTSAANTCNDWTVKTASYSSMTGQSAPAATDYSWTAAFSYICSGQQLMSLICVEQS